MPPGAALDDLLSVPATHPFNGADLAAVRDAAAELAREAAIGPDAARRQAARRLLTGAAPQLGARAASIAPYYMALARGEIPSATAPAVNIRGLTFDTALALFRAMRATDCAAAIAEINRAEFQFTSQAPDEFAAVVLGAAMAAGYEGPVFIQGDHFQASLPAYTADPEAEARALEELIERAVAAGFYCIDIDASTLVDLSYDHVRDQQRVNAQLTARLVRHIRHVQPAGITVSIGGEIGEVGAHNSTVDELVAYMEQVREMLDGDLTGITKVSVQAGTTHGGIRVADGSVAPVAIDFDTLAALSAVARDRYGMAGVVQHGASTLPAELFHRFPPAGVAEVHLATGFQDLILDHEAFPAELRGAMHEYVLTAFGHERKEGESDIQFVRRLRRKGWGFIKAAAWEIDPACRAAIRDSLQAQFEHLIHELGVAGSAAAVRRYIS